MKYLIIDTEQLKQHWALWERLINSEYMLSEVESLGIFAQIWDDGLRTGERIYIDTNKELTDDDYDMINESWGEFKNTL